jgi:hypothetical protein
MSQSTLTFSHFPVGLPLYRSFALSRLRYSRLPALGSPTPESRCTETSIFSCRDFATSRPRDLNLPIFGLSTYEPRAREIPYLGHLSSTHSCGPTRLTSPSGYRTSRLRSFYCREHGLQPTKLRCAILREDPTILVTSRDSLGGSRPSVLPNEFLRIEQSASHTKTCSPACAFVLIRTLQYTTFSCNPPADSKAYSS